MISLVNEYTLELTTVPFSKREDEVVYIASKQNAQLDAFIQGHLSSIEGIFKAEYLSFIYRPEISSLSSDIEPSCVSSKTISENSAVSKCRAFHLSLKYLDNDSLMMQQFKDIAKAFSRRESIDYSKAASDQETVEMLTEMERLARSLKLKGVKSELFDSMIQSLEQPVSMTVMPSGVLKFTDFGDMEIRLNPAEKTVYFLFLNHPEGILPDAVVGYRDELIELYRRASIYDEWHSPEDTVDSICAEDKNVLYSTISKIKTRFKVMGEKRSCHYIISKDSRTGKYRIPLDPSMVVWMGQSWIVK